MFRRFIFVFLRILMDGLLIESVVDKQKPITQYVKSQVISIVTDVVS